MSRLEHVTLRSQAGIHTTIVLARSRFFRCNVSWERLHYRLKDVKVAANFVSSPPVLTRHKCHQCPVSDSVLLAHRLHDQMPSPGSRESDAMPSSTATSSPAIVAPSDSSSDAESYPTAAAQSYPSVASTQAGRGSDPPPPPPSAPKGAHAEYQKLLQQRHRERLSLHKNQVSTYFLSVLLVTLLAVDLAKTTLL